MLTSAIRNDSTYLLLRIHVSTRGDQVLHDVNVSCYCGQVQRGLLPLRIEHITLGEIKLENIYLTKLKIKTVVMNLGHNTHPLTSKRVGEVI